MQKQPRFVYRFQKKIRYLRRRPFMLEMDDFETVEDLELADWMISPGDGQ